MSALARYIQGSLLVKPKEQKSTLVAFIMVFILMAAYFVLRPVRDAMASDWSDAELSWLWNIQFFMSIALVALYSYAVSVMRFAWVVPAVYSAFALSFMAFYGLTPLIDDPSLVEKAFYLWVTAFSLFNLSVFWSFMSDTFNPEQGRRLFAVIGAGASAGAIVGPSIPSLLAQYLGLDKLLFVAALGLFLVVPLIFYLQHLKTTELGNQQRQLDVKHVRIDGPWWSGFKDVLMNPYLFGIAIFITLYVFIGSFIYFEQKNILAAYSRVERAQILGGIDWIVNSLTFILAFFATGRLVNRLGMPFTLALIPVLLVLGLLTLAFAPMVTVLLGVQIVRRVGNYSVTRPAREMLFTQVTSDQRFKAKSVIDVVVYRGGDALSGSLFALLSEGFALSLAVLSIIGAVMAGLWAWCGIGLGQRYRAGDCSREERELVTEGLVRSQG